MANDKSTFTEEFGYIIDQFDELEDLRWSDLQYLDEYRELRMKKNDGEPVDQARLEQLEVIFKNKIVTSARWNKFQNALVGMETFIKDEVEGYIEGKQGEMEQFVEGKQGEIEQFVGEMEQFVEDKQGEMEQFVEGKQVEVNSYVDNKTGELNTKIDNFKHRGTYNPTTQYYEKNTVDFDDGSGSQVYIALEDTKGNDPATNKWNKLTIQGARGQKGADGVGLKFQGEYDPNKSYNKDDGVQFGGILYGSLVNLNEGNEPSPSQDTEYWAKALDVTVTVRKLSGVRNVTSQTDNVNFITGEITSFNKNVDSLSVYQNSVRLAQGVDYEINANNSSIDKLDDIWDGTIEPVFFEFEVIKNVLNDLVFSDGSSIADGTIHKSKLVLDLQDDIDKIDILTEKVNPETPLNTTSQNLSDAVNELKNEIDFIEDELGNISFAENVKNFVVNSINQGMEVELEWENSADGTFLENEIYVSTTDIENANYEYCVANADLIYNGENEEYLYNTTQNILYYFKIFSKYSMGGLIQISKGVSVSVLTEDLTPPGSATDIQIKTDDKSAIITYIPPIDDDYMGTRLVYKKDDIPTDKNDGVVIGNYISGAEITGLDNDEEYFFRLFPYDMSGNYNDDIGQVVSGIPTEIKIYGIKIDEANSNPETAVTYIDGAVGFTPMLGNNGDFQWGSWEQIFNEMEIKPCLFKDGQVNYYLNPNDYTKKTDGTKADITSGNDGDVMVEFPKIYWKINKVGTDLYVKFSTKYFDGAICKAHTVGSTEKDKIYISAYMGSNLSNKLRSLSGKTPYVGGTAPAGTIGTCRTMAQANGAGYQQMAYYPLLMLQVLYIVFFKDRDSQTALGRGYVDGNSVAINTGGTNTKGMFYGEATGKLQNKFCGIEDFWGNTFYWIDGMYSDASRNIMISKQDVFNDNGSGYVNHGQGATTNVNGYIGTVQGGNETGFIIKTAGGSGSTYYPDHGYLNAERLACFGGNWSHGDNAGAFQLRVVPTASHSNANYSGRLWFLGHS